MPAIGPVASTITVGGLLDRWLDEAVALTVRPRTLASYRTSSGSTSARRSATSRSRR